MAAPQEGPTACLVAGRWREGPGFEVLDKYALRPLARVTAADGAMVAEALAAAESYVPPPPHERAALLHRTRATVAERRAAFRRLMALEAGFPAADAEGEIARALETLRLSAEEAGRIAGETVPLEGQAAGAGRLGFTLRVPIGIVVAITPSMRRSTLSATSWAPPWPPATPRS